MRHYRPNLDIKDREPARTGKIRQARDLHNQPFYVRRTDIARKADST